MDRTELEPDEVHERLDEVQLLDVREPDEWEAGRIEGAHHLPMGQLAARQEEIAEDRPVVAVCRSGARSGQVASALRRAGYEAYNLRGGLKAWSRADLPMSADDGDPHVA